ncbi:hypothetical protein NQZ68_023005 [Dissostichus eleginoides]|nr:hypothetical protein NQZ68_023005 [Dissostichus eleginoides]
MFNLSLPVGGKGALPLFHGPFRITSRPRVLAQVPALSLRSALVFSLGSSLPSSQGPASQKVLSKPFPPTLIKVKEAFQIKLMRADMGPFSRVSGDVSTLNRLQLNGPGDSRFGVSA